MEAVTRDCDRDPDRALLLGHLSRATNGISNSFLGEGQTRPRRDCCPTQTRDYRRQL